MEQLLEIIPGNTLHALGWTVLHSLWQGLAIALLLAVYLFAAQKKSPHKRYLASFAALGSTLLAAVITFFSLLEDGSGEVAAEILVADGTLLGTYFLQPDAPVFFEKLNQHMPLIVVAWLVGMAFFLLKMMGGLLYVERLKHRHLSAVPVAWQGILENLQRQLGLRTAVRLTASALVKVPMVVGWLKPVVLLPIGAVNQLSAGQVEAILAHELAHIARHDYLLNLAQSLIEVLFYFNPAVWWVSARIRTEREHCCDDLAVALCGSPLAYARALVSLREMQGATPTFALSFAAGKNQLLARIQRILQQPSTKSYAMEKISVAGLVLAAVIALSFRAPSNPNLAPSEGGAVASSFDFSKTVLSPLHFSRDTTPPGKVALEWSDNDGTGTLKIMDGKITYLEIDGEEIPASQYAEHEALVSELLKTVENPPAPPAPPSPPGHEFPKAPASPSPPRAPRFPEAAPAPPAPPAPPAQRITTERNGKTTTIHIEGRPRSKSERKAKTERNDKTITIHIEGRPRSKSERKAKTERNGKTTTIHIEGVPSTEPLEIEVEGGRKGTVTINGEELENLQDGSQTITLGNPNLFFHDGARARTFWFPEGEVPEIVMLEKWQGAISKERLRFAEESEVLRKQALELAELPTFFQDDRNLQAQIFELDTQRKLETEQRRGLAEQHREGSRQQQEEVLEQLRMTREQAREMEREILRQQRGLAKQKKAM